MGIDPGHTGAIAVLDPDGNLLDVHDTPLTGKEYDTAGMLTLIRSVSPVKAALERQQTFPGQGGVSNFTTGHGYGLWMGLLAASGIPFDLVRAQDWKKALGIPAGSDKSASVAAAQRLFPGGDFTGPRGGMKDGRADAVLLAEWRRRAG